MASATITRQIPVVCDTCRGDLIMTRTTNEAGNRRTIVLACASCGEVDCTEQKLETVRAFLTGPDHCGQANIGRIWVPA